MAETTAPLLSVAFSSRVLFDLTESHSIYEAEGEDAFARYQQERENEPLKAGPALGLVQKLSKLNQTLKPEWPDGCIRMILISRNSPDSGVRVLHSLEHHQLGTEIGEGVFTAGDAPWRYAQKLGCQLFLSCHSEDVRLALDAGIAAASMLDWSGSPALADAASDQIRFAFDGDSVLFSDEAERVYQEQGIEGFERHEQKLAQQPMKSGPFKPIIEALNQLQQIDSVRDRIRTALVTARGLSTAERPTQTLRSWQVRVDEMMLCNGDNKLPVLEVFRPDIFFDDRLQNCTSASEVTASGHVNAPLEPAAKEGSR